MANLNTARALNTNTMHWDYETKTLSAEASTCRYNGCYRLYDDAADFGVWVKSHKTNKLVPFSLQEQEKDADGDTRFWRFTGWGIKGLVATLIIFND